MDQKNIKLSIITINFNNGKGLELTLDSVACQTFRNFEHIVIDGGSTDNSLEVIKSYQDNLAYWISEHDNGIYNAMNKGVRAAHGEYCLFLNSGDQLLNSKVLRQVFESCSNKDIVSGTLQFDKGGVWTPPEEVSLRYFLEGSITHPSSFIRKHLLMEHPYNENFKIMGDREFFAYAFLKLNASYQYINITVSLFDTTGISSQRNHSVEDWALYRNCIDRIIPPRIMSDYDYFMGRNNRYNYFFYKLCLAHRMKRVAYYILVGLLKILTLNHGWIKQFKL